MEKLSGHDHDPNLIIPDTLSQQILDGFKNTDAKLIEYPLEGEPKSFSADALFQRAIYYSHLFEKIEPELPLVLCMARIAEFLPAAWASILLGRWYIPWQVSPLLNKSTATNARLTAMQQCFTEACLVTAPELKQWVTKQCASTIGWKTLILNNDDEPLSKEQATPEITNGGGCYLPTSGSSGGARFVRIRNQTLCARHAAALGSASIKSRVKLNTFPFDGVTGHSSIFPWEGTQVVFPTARLLTRPDELPDLVEKQGINVLALSTTMLAKLVDVLERSDKDLDLSGLQSIGLGAEPLSPSLINRLHAQCRRHGNAAPNIFLGYGMTETGTIAKSQLQNIDNVELDTKKSLCVGSCTRFTAVRVTDENNQPVKTGVAGQIQVLAPQRMFDGYQTENGLDTSAFTEDGWFCTGDRGFIDSEQLVVMGRVSASMKVGGRRISLEQIETALQGFPGIVPGTLVAAPILPVGADVDELGLFFSPLSVSSHSNDPNDLVQALRLAVIDLVGVAPRHFISLPEETLLRTASAKSIRPQLVANYLAGVYESTPEASEFNDDLTDIQGVLINIWKQVLSIDEIPAKTTSFFELGADSLAVAEMVEQVESKFSVRLPLQPFFLDPSLGNLTNLIECALASTEIAPSQDAMSALIRKLETSLKSWSGNRIGPQKLIPGCNLTGSATSIFWVFQSEGEFSLLGEQLPDENPLFGMRSMVEFLPIREHNQTVLDTLCDFYLPEILALRPRGRIILGGNCQGGIIALALARRLLQIGRAPDPLVLMEWSFSYGPYKGEVELLYGEKSHTARLYTSPQAGDPDWQGDFCPRQVGSIRGAHAQFFQEENIDSLVAELCRISNNTASEKSSVREMLTTNVKKWFKNMTS